MLDLNADLKARALAYAAENMIAGVGDIVEIPPWGDGKRSQMVMIVGVGARLVSVYSDELAEFRLEFDMTYVAHRVTKDGFSKEAVPASGICLNHLYANDGRKWSDKTTVRPRNRAATTFNHAALCWTLQEIPWGHRREVLCRPPKPV